MKNFIHDYQNRQSQVYKKTETIEYFEVYQIFANCLNEYLKYFNKKLNDIRDIVEQKGTSIQSIIISSVLYMIFLLSQKKHSL